MSPQLRSDSLRITRGPLAMSGSVVGCDNGDHPVIRWGEARVQANTPQCTDQLPMTQGVWPHMLAVPRPEALPACHPPAQEPRLPARPRKNQALHWGFTNFISRLFMFVFCLLLETCRLHVCHSVQPKHADPKCPPTRDPHSLAGHRTDSAVLPRPAPGLWPSSAHHVHPPPPPRGQTVPQGPRLVQTEMLQPERLR